jgi:hypothetical protein
MRGDGKGSAGCGEQQRGTPSTKGKLLKWRNQTSEKTGAGPVITVFLLFLLLFHAAWYSYILHWRRLPPQPTKPTPW